MAADRATPGLNPPVRPARLGWFIATVLALSMSVAIATWRYPDSETVRIERGASFPSGCFPVDETTCVFAYVDNVWGRVFTIGAGGLVAAVTFAVGFRRSLDLPSQEHGPAA